MILDLCCQVMDLSLLILQGYNSSSLLANTPQAWDPTLWGMQTLRAGLPSIIIYRWYNLNPGQWWKSELPTELSHNSEILSMIICYLVSGQSPLQVLEVSGEAQCHCYHHKLFLTTMILILVYSGSSPLTHILSSLTCHQTIVLSYLYHKPQSAQWM